MDGDGVRAGGDGVLAGLRRCIRAHSLADEDRVLSALLPLAEGGGGGAPLADALHLVEVIRRRRIHRVGVEALLNEYSLASADGLVLMRLGEALLRVPDTATADRLIADVLPEGDWAAHIGGGRHWFITTSACLLWLCARLVDGRKHGLPRRRQPLLGSLAQPLVRSILYAAVAHMGGHFAMASTIGDALVRARKLEARGFRYSYDMLGEGARTATDARRYLDNYRLAIDAIGAAAGGRGPVSGPGISVKLSALHPRYDASQQRRVLAELAPRLEQLALAAKAWNIGLTVDAEEARRLELSLDVCERVFSSPALAGWEGFGIAVQACQKRALPVIDWCRALAEGQGRRLAVRLVKGAYWDSEIKYGQQQGLDDYPVFTRKQATDVSYLACARRLLACRDWLYPQFATHNAATVTAILALDTSRQGYEFQRLQGMGEALYRELGSAWGMPCRIYGPVGRHGDLLSYLVRRLLENGVNSSFVNRVLDPATPAAALVEDPVAQLRALASRRNPAIPRPAEIYGAGRRNARGADLGDPGVLAELRQAVVSQREQGKREQGKGEQGAGGIPVYNPANSRDLVGSHPGYASGADMVAALSAADAAFASWSQTPLAARSSLLERFADSLERRRDEFLALCVREAGKTLADSLAEIREAVDFCRYYARQAEEVLAVGQYRPRGVLLCISPWNFPLAIFVGQVVAALVAGNTVVAKPAEQTSLVARRAVDLLLGCGLPPGALQLLISPGPPVGEQLLGDPRLRGVLFTGSVATGQWLNRALAQRPDCPLPLIAETGGQNAMVVDATALPEQVVDDVIRSGFLSAGQRCSALRVLFLPVAIAPRVIAMLKGAMAELHIGDPAQPSTDVGPVIDARALARLDDHLAYLEKHGQLLYRCELPARCTDGHFFAPRLYEIEHLSVLKAEVFGPVVHVVRYRDGELAQVIQQIHATGYGLTLGIHSRNPVLGDYLARQLRVGNVYINRDMIGAVVGVQPFGGRGLSGTGPKAGGPHYLPRLVEFTAEPAPEPVWPPLSIPPEDTVAPPRAAAPLATGVGLAELASAGEAWGAVAAANRRDILLGVLAKLGQRGLVPPQWLGALADRLQHAAALLAGPAVLPGPAGESNRLVVESAGVALCLVTGPTELWHWLGGLMTALAAGNPVLALATGPLLEVAVVCHRIFARAGLPAAVATLDSPGQLQVLIADPRLAAVLLAPGSAWRPALARLLAARDGAILPLVCEPPGAALVMRLVREKTVTNNTAAIGGNAALLMAAVGASGAAIGG